MAIFLIYFLLYLPYFSFNFKCSFIFQSRLSFVLILTIILTIIFFFTLYSFPPYFSSLLHLHLHLHLHLCPSIIPRPVCPSQVISPTIPFNLYMCPTPLLHHYLHLSPSTTSTFTHLLTPRLPPA